MRGDQCAQLLVGGAGPRRRSPALLEQALERDVLAGVEQVVLALEVVVERPRRHAQAGGDLAHAGPVEALLPEDGGRLLQDLRAAVAALLGRGIGGVGVDLNHGSNSSSPAGQPPRKRGQETGPGDGKGVPRVGSEAVKKSRPLPGGRRGDDVPKNGPATNGDRGHRHGGQLRPAPSRPSQHVRAVIPTQPLNSCGRRSPAPGRARAARRRLPGA